MSAELDPQFPQNEYDWTEFQNWVEMGMLDFAIHAAERAGNEPTFEFWVGACSFAHLDDAISFGLAQKELTKVDVSVQARMKKNGIVVFEAIV